MKNIALYTPTAAHPSKGGFQELPERRWLMQVTCQELKEVHNRHEELPRLSTVDLSGGSDCSASHNIALSSVGTKQHAIVTLKDTCLKADHWHPGLTSTTSTFWNNDPMKSSDSSPSIWTSKDRASSIVCPAIPSNSSQSPASARGTEPQCIAG